jgi:hypothetical protein
MLQPFDLAIAGGVLVLAVLFLWFRLGRPWPGRSRSAEAAPAQAAQVDPAEPLSRAD